MTQTPEQALYQKLRDKLEGDICRIENVAGNGLPDLNICYNGIEIWVELKALNHNKVLLRPEQYAWAKRRANHGGSCYVLNYDPGNPIVSVCIWAFPNIDIQPAGKYVRITSVAHFSCDMVGRQLMKALFPMF